MDAVVADAGKGRTGYSAAPSTDTLFALPAMQGDSLVFVPFTFSQHRRGAKGTLPNTVVRALEKARLAKSEYARQLAAMSPQDVDARLRFAESLEAIGELTSISSDGVGALSEYEAARRLSVGVDLKARTLNAIARIHLKLRDPTSFRMMLDSMSGEARSVTSDGARWFAALAVGLQNEALASQLLALQWSSPATERQEFGMALGSTLRKELAEFWVAVALGHCDQDIIDRERRIEESLVNVVEKARVDSTRERLLGRAWSLMAPCDAGVGVLKLRSPRESILRAQIAVARGESTTARQLVRESRRRRNLARAADTSIDTQWLEASILRAIGDSADAGRAIDDILGALSRAPPYITTDIVQIGTLLQVCKHVLSEHRDNREHNNSEFCGGLLAARSGATRSGG